MHLSDVGRWIFLSEASARQHWRPEQENHSFAVRQHWKNKSSCENVKHCSEGADDDDDNNSDGPAW